MRVVTFNLHAGVDGYGRATDVVDFAASLRPDLLMAQEVWRGTREDQFDELRARCGLEGHYVPLGEGQRSTTAAGGRGWQSPLALVRGEVGLFFDERRPLTAFQRRVRDAATDLEGGTWGLALLTNRPIDSLVVTELPQLARDKVRRALITARLADASTPFTAIAVHGAHLTSGSLGQYRHVQRHAHDQLAAGPVVMGGDFNCWRPLLRTALRGWQSGVRAKTWPSWRPHSQIDHLLLGGSWQRGAGYAARGPSDHRALVLEARP